MRQRTTGRRKRAKSMQARVKGMIGDELDLVEAELTRGGHRAGIAEFSAADVQMMFPLEFAANSRRLTGRPPCRIARSPRRMQARRAYRRAVDSGGAIRLRWSRKLRDVMRAHGSEDRAAPPSAA